MPGIARVCGLVRFHNCAFARKVATSQSFWCAVLKQPIEDNPFRIQRGLWEIIRFGLEFNYVKSKKQATNTIQCFDKVDGSGFSF